MKNFEEKVEKWDSKIIWEMRRLAMPVSRFAIFLIYFWFGALKVFSASHGAAGPLVSALLEKTLGGNPETFLIVFGVFEIIIGLIFIIPNLERLGIFFLFLHLVTTAMPLFLLPGFAWEGFLVPTLEGQYIIKNILIIAVAVGILAHLHTLRHQK